MPVPYMGSKRKSAGKIYQAIKNLNEDNNTIVDLFCGGFGIGEYFLKNGWKVIANDKNKYVVALLDQTINKGLGEAKCLEFVTRERFNDVVQNPDKYEDWYVGYVQCIWSFGNTQKAYLFGTEVEKYKLEGHNYVVNNVDIAGIKNNPSTNRYKRRIYLGLQAKKKFAIGMINPTVKENYKKYKQIIESDYSKEVCLEFTKWLRSTGITAKEVNQRTNSQMASHYLTQGSQPAIPTKEMWENLKKSPKLKNIPEHIYNLFTPEKLYKQKELIKLERLQQLERLQRLQQLEQLEQLQRLQQLERLQQATFQSGDYQDVIIPDGAVIYCDPPYKGTAEYKEGGFNHKEFWGWVRIKSKTHKVYISEYNAPDDFESVLEFEQKSTLQGGTQQHSSQPKEKLFTIIKGKT